MKKILTALLITGLFIAFKIDVFALDPACTQAEQLRLRQLASATQITYEFFENVEEGYRGYKVQISGFGQDFYIYNKEIGIYLQYNGTPVVASRAFGDGMTYSLPFYASDSSVCKGYFILTKSVTLPKYNVYSKHPLCVGHEEYELCKKFTPIRVTSDIDFERRMKQYIKDLEKKDDIPDVVKPAPEKTMLDHIKDFFANNYMFILISIIVLGTTGIVIIEVKKRRSIL